MIVENLKLMGYREAWELLLPAEEKNKKREDFTRKQESKAPPLRLIGVDAKCDHRG